MLKIEGLDYQYSNAAAFQFPDLECQRGENWLLLGRSGSGKTTFLSLIGGLLKAKQGKIQIDGTDIARLSSKELDHFRGQHIGIVFQKSHFVKSLSVEENLLLAQSLAGKKPDKKRIHDLLGRLGVDLHARRMPYQLSIGEQQRVAIARALVNAPSLILADEPTSALDDGHALEVANLLQEASQDANALLMIVTHDNRLTSRFEKHIHLN